MDPQMIEQTLAEHIVNRNRYLAGELEYKDAQLEEMREALAALRKRVHILQTEVCRYRNARDLWRQRATGKAKR